MIRVGAAGLLMGIMLAPVGWSQQDVSALEHTLKGRPMALRSYSADPVASYALAGSTLVPGPIRLHTLGVFTTRSVKVRRDTIVLDGERETLVRDVEKNEVEPVSQVPMRLEVDLRGGDAATVLSKLKGMLFFPDTKSAIAGLPKQVAETLPFDTRGLPVAKCSCEYVYDGGRWIRLEPPFVKYTHPVLLSGVAPKFSKEALKENISGAVTLMFYVSEVGEIGEIWLASPLGFGLDERAADAIREYVFKPAEYDGRPVGTELVVAVKFQMF